MKRYLIFLAILAMMLPIVAWAQVTGDTCLDPILLNLPVVDQEFDNEGMANDYTSGMFTGLTASTYYLNGYDWVGKITLPTDSWLNINMAEQTGYSGQYLGMFLVNTIPSTASPAAVIAQSYGSTGPYQIREIYLPAGDYYLIVDNWPSPYDFYFVLNIDTNAPTAEPLPYSQDFETGTSLAAVDWTGDMSIGTNHGTNGSKGLYRNLYSSVTTANAVTPLLGPLPANAQIMFDYRYVEYSSYPSTPLTLSAGDKLEVQILIGGDFQTIHTIDQNNHITSTEFASVIVPLDGYAGLNTKVKFLATRGAGDYYIDVDNVVVRETPEDPIFTYSPTSINFGTIMNATPSAPQYVVIANTGAGVINLSEISIALIGANHDEFDFDASNLPASFVSGVNGNISVSVTAQSEGPITATLRIVYGGVNYDVALSAVGMPAGTVVIGNGTSTSRFPLGSYYGYERSAALYTAAEIGSGNKRINTLGWYATTANNDLVPTKIYLKEYANNTLASSTWANFILGATSVYDATIAAVPAGDWFMIELDNTFDLDNGSNLLVLVERDYGGGGGSAGSTNPAIRATAISNMHHTILQDNNPPTGTSSTQTSRPNLMFLSTSYELTDPPNPAVVVFPQDGAGMISTTVTLNWGSGGGGPTGYKLYLGQTNPPAFVGDLGDVNTYTVPEPLAGEATYYWQVIPYNASGDATNCPVWSFETLPEGMMIIGTGTATQRQPFNHYFGFERSAAIYTPAQYGVPGLITQAGWYCAQASAAAVPYKIYAGTTTNAAFTAGAWANLVEDLTLVKQGSYTFNETGWVLFDLDTPFVLDGDNLILAIESNYGGGGTSPYPMFRYTTATTGSHQYWNADTNPPATNGYLNTQLPNVMLHILQPSGPAEAPILVSPANGATGLPVEGFNLTWRPNLNDGGFPEYYAIFMAQDEDEIFDAEYFETEDTHFNPVLEGGITFNHSERWYWAVEAYNVEGSAVSDIYRFDIIAAPAQISVSPGFFNEELEVGETSTQPLYITNAGGLPLDYSIRFEDYTDDIRAAYSPVIHQIQPRPKAADLTERAPFAGGSTGGSRAYLDLQFIYENVGTGAGEYGVSSDGEFIYTSRWSAVADQRIFKYSLDGEYLGYFEIPGFSGVRDFTYDGTYFYGATNSTTVYVMDFANESLVRSFIVPVDARGIAYDADRNGLWITNGWNGPLRLVDMNGALLQTLNTSAVSMAGLAYDALSGNGSIWANVQDGETTNTLVEIDAETGEVLNSMEITADFIPGLDADSSAGGIDVVTGVVPGYATIIANAQNTLMYGLELCPMANWAKAEPKSGVVAPGTTATIDIHFDTEGLPAGLYEGMFTINHSAPADIVDLPVTLTVTGDWLPIFNIDEATWDFGTAELMNPIRKEFTIRNSGGPYLTLTANSFYISGDTEGNFSLELEDLPAELAYNGTYRFKVVFAPQSLGNKTASLNIEDGLGRALHQVALSGACVAEPIGEILNLQANVENISNVRLNWGLSSGVAGEPGWLHYDNGDNNDGIGTGGTANFDVAIKFTSADLYGYVGMQLEKIKFFPKSGNTDYALKIWTGSDYNLAPSTLMYTQELDDVTPDQWNEVILDTPFPISADEAIWFGYNCDVLDGGTQNHPAGSDSGPAVVGKGDVIFLGNWYSMKNQYGLDYNWNLQGYVNDAIAITGTGHWLNTPVENRDSGLQDIRNLSLSTSGNPAPATRVLRGFNIYRNGTQVNNELVPSPTYLDLGLEDGVYTYTVQGVYYSGNTTMSDPAEVEIITPPALVLPYSQDFEAHADNSLPEGWMRSSNGLGWEIGTDLSSQYWTIPAHTVYAAANDDTNGSGNDGSVDYLNMPALDFNVADGGSIILSFDSYFTAAYGQLAYVKVSTDNLNWDLVYTVPSASVWTTRSVDLTAYSGNDNVYIRFHSSDDGDWASGWAIDNVLVDVVFTDNVPPVITHLPLINTPITNAPYEVIAHVVDDETWNNAITTVQLNYAIDDGDYIAVNMVHSGDDIYVGYIPAQELDTEIDYYITAMDSEGNEAISDDFGFGVYNPVYLYYDLGGSTYVTFGQVYGPAVLFDNPFYGTGTPMQLLTVDGDLYYADEVTLVIYEVTATGFAPVYMADVEFDGINYGVFDLSEEDVIIEGEQFLVAYQGVPADNYFLIDRNAYYYGRSYVIIGGQIYAVSENDGAWAIGALVTDVVPEELDIPELSIALNADGYPTLSWTAVDGAAAYSIEISDDPYATQWSWWDTVEQTNYTYDGEERAAFFRVTATSEGIRAISQSYPISLSGEIFRGTRAIKAPLHKVDRK